MGQAPAGLLGYLHVANAGLAVSGQASKVDAHSFGPA